MRSLVLRAFALLLPAACLLLAACSSSSDAPSSPSANNFPTSQAGNQGGATSSCMDKPLPHQSPMDTRDAWQIAHALLPSGVGILRPASVPDRFSDPNLLAACVEAGSTPVYTVLYKAGDESLVFILNQGADAWGNTPGPPSSRPEVTVRSVDATMTITALLDGGTPTGVRFFDLSWIENGMTYQIKASSARLTQDDIVQLANGLEPAK